MKRTNILVAGILAGLTSVSAVASAQSGVTAHGGRAAKVQLRNTSLGKILVNASGFTLYSFTKDSRNKDVCVRISGCSEIWKPLSTSAKPTAGPGVKASLLSTITLPGGTKQVTYAGRPLYLYVPSSERAETSYVGVIQFGGRWYAANAAGKTVK